MHDMYKEIQITRQPSEKDKMIVISLGILTALCAVAGLLFQIIILIPAIVFGFLAWWKKSFLHLEYEYAYTNGQIDVDRILDARRRKRIATYHPEKLLCLAPKGSVALGNYPRDIKVADYTSGDENMPYYVAIYQTENGQLAVWLELPVEVVSDMRRLYPRAVSMD